MRAHLTDVSVRAFKTDGAQFKVWDTNTRGFGVLVGKSKSWIVMHGRDRRLKVVGRVSDMGLADARKAAKKYLANGLPSASLSFTDAVTLFLGEKARARRPRTVRDYKRLLGRLSMPLDVEPHDLAKKLALFKAPAEYNHLIVALKVFFNWCVKRKYISFNPAVALSQNKRTRRTRTLTDDELKLIWRACSNALMPNGHEATLNAAIPKNFATIVKLLILTGQRRGEIAALQSSWICRTNNQTHETSSEGYILTFPAEVTKNGREHLLPLGSLAESVLKSAMKAASTPFLFLARGGSGNSFSGWSKGKKALDELSGVTGWTLHDLRRGYRTIHGRLRTPSHIAERLLNHISARAEMEETYDQHKYLEEMREAVNNYERWFVEHVLHSK